MTLSAPETTDPTLSDPGSLVVVDQLVKRYPKRPVNAVDGVSFTVRLAEVFGLLGPNGAGKTTTIGVLTTRVRPTSGRAAVAGIDVAGSPVDAKRRLAVVPQRTNLDRSLSARQNLLFHAAYFGMPDAERQARADLLLDQFGLADRGGDKVDRLSGGQSQRLMIARALMHEPQVLFLDEPTTGLDPQARLFVWDRIRELRGHGVTVVITTHDMDEASELADRVGIMDHGRLLALDTPEALTASVPGNSMLEVGVSLDQAAPDGDAERLVQALSALPGVERSERVEAVPAAPAGNGAPWGAGPPPWAGGAGAPAPPAPPGGADDGQVRLRLYASVDAASLVVPVARALVERHATLTDLRLGQPTLEDVFIALTGRGLR